MKSAAIYLRVSTEEQDFNNQMLAIRPRCEAEDWRFADVDVFAESESAWMAGHQTELARFLDVIESGKRRYDVLVILALDRLSREGIERTFGLIRRIQDRGCQVVSLKEPFTAADSPMREVFIAIVSWSAHYESERKSQNTRLGLAKALAEGKTLGRPKGRKDDPDKPRRRAGYLLRYAGKAARASFHGVGK